jgi:hypothetical protein
VYLLSEHTSRGNKMQVDDSLALSTPLWLVCPVEHPDGATNSCLIPYEQQFCMKPQVCQESPDFWKPVNFGSLNIVVNCSLGPDTTVQSNKEFSDRGNSLGT